MMDCHITIVQHGSRRLMGARGSRSNLCGAELTAYDVNPADARVIIRTAWTASDRRLCPLCVARLSSAAARRGA